MVYTAFLITRSLKINFDFPVVHKIRKNYNSSFDDIIIRVALSKSTIRPLRSRL